MLKSTFLHLKGISKKKEKHLWAKGIVNQRAKLTRVLG
jgi:hypothetical protein